MNNSIFNKLSPHERKFYPMLNNLASLIEQAAKLITECVTCYSGESAKQYFSRIKDVEREGDKITNEIFDELNRTFITPFDREDIHDLAYRLDDVIDYINKCAKRIAIYNPIIMPQTAADLTNILIEQSHHIQLAVQELDKLKSDHKDIQEHCHQLHCLENTADDIYEQFIVNLFEDPPAAIEVIKLKEIMYELEQATDAAEEVSIIIKTIIVKYA